MSDDLRAAAGLALLFLHKHRGEMIDAYCLKDRSGAPMLETLSKKEVEIVREVDVIIDDLTEALPKDTTPHE